MGGARRTDNAEKAFAVGAASPKRIRLSHPPLLAAARPRGTCFGGPALPAADPLADRLAQSCTNGARAAAADCQRAPTRARTKHDYRRAHC